MPCYFILIFCFLHLISQAQSTAWKRAQTMGKGMNLSWMDQRWNGTEEEEHRDYLDLDSLPYIKRQIALMHDLGFQLLRFPVCFELWYESEAPYHLIKPEYYAALDSVIRWTAEKKMILIIDNHHGTLSSAHVETDTKRICAIWNEVAKRYTNSDAERIFFEIFNEPNQLSKEEWEYSAQKIIFSIKKQAPHHTLIIGASEWNGLKALQSSSLFADSNIIYTFHFYDPFIYTHQGASWAGDAVLTTGIPYPYSSQHMPPIHPKASGTWAAGLFRQYPTEGTYQAMENRLNSIKEWSQKNNVPIFCGEWGAYNKYTEVKDRCAYLNDVYKILHQLSIPNAMWEWDASFSFFEGKPAKDTIIPCMKGIVEGK
ncbi:MAG: cellulase family glycosylhydrolase [Cytophagaceae bacterium]|nr:cellulase family glycosylhydrolase [Cytophagaceae bacterium]